MRFFVKAFSITLLTQLLVWAWLLLLQPNDSYIVTVIFLYGYYLTSLIVFSLVGPIVAALLPEAVLAWVISSFDPSALWLWSMLILPAVIYSIVIALGLLAVDQFKR